MKIAHTIARILLGLIFLLAGVSGYVLLAHGPPPMPQGLANDFQRVYFASRMVLFTDTVMALCGLAFLANRYLGLAVVTSAAIIFNIWAFHITMQPMGLSAPFILTVLWVFIALPYRDRFEPLLRA